MSIGGFSLYFELYVATVFEVMVAVLTCASYRTSSVHVTTATYSAGRGLKFDELGANEARSIVQQVYNL